MVARTAAGGRSHRGAWIVKGTRAALAVLVAREASASAPSSREISFATADGGTVVADLYGDPNGAAVVLAHGAVFDKESWRPLATALAERGFAVLAIDFRGYGASKPSARPGVLAEDVLAAVRWARTNGARSVAVVGASRGGGAAAEASVAARPGEIDRLVLLSPAPIAQPELIRGPVLFVASAEESGISRIREQYDRVPEPKRLVLLPGAAHAQHVFATEQSARLTTAILEFLSATRP